MINDSLLWLYVLFFTCLGAVCIFTTVFPTACVVKPSLNVFSWAIDQPDVMDATLVSVIALLMHYTLSLYFCV